MLEGYISKTSFDYNENINIYVSSNESITNILIFDFYDKNTYYENNFNTKIQNVDKYDFAEGCKWDISHVINLIKLNLNHGLYIIKLYNKDDDFYIPFIIKNKNKNKIVVILNTNTWAAYNLWNGISYYRCINDPEIQNSIYCKKYDFNEGDCSFVSSFNKPNIRISDEIRLIFDEKYILDTPNFHLLYGEKYLFNWLKNNNYKFDFLTDIDIEDMNLLIDRKIIFLNCHPEYWSHKMYYNLLHVTGKLGINLIYLGGNGLYKKIYINKNCNRIEKLSLVNYNDNLNIYKNILSTDKFANKNKLTVEPCELLGMFYDSIKNDGSFSDFLCINNSWIFNGTSIKIGDIIGKKYDVFKPSGHETDKKNHNLLKNQTKIYKNNIILGKGNHPDGGEIILHKFKKSNIFSCGSIPFTRCIDDPDITIILNNVIKKFLL